MLCRYKFSNPNYWKADDMECVKKDCASWHKGSEKCADLLAAECLEEIVRSLWELVKWKLAK